MELPSIWISHEFSLTFKYNSHTCIKGQEFFKDNVAALLLLKDNVAALLLLYYT